MRHDPSIPAPASVPSSRRAQALLTVALAALPFVVLAILLADARPYWVFETDAEADYYYNARLILKNGTPRGFLHPGTPIYYLVAAIVALVGRSVGQAQRCMQVGYILIAVASSACLWWTLRRSSARGTWTATAVGVALVLAWPAVITHWGYLCSDAFLPVVGIPLVVAAYDALSGAPGSGDRPAKRVAAAFGLCLAIKLSFAPLALAFLAGAAVSLGRAPTGAGGGRPWAYQARAAAAWAGLAGRMVGVFLLCTLPSLPRLPATILGNIMRSDVRPQGHAFAGLLSTAATLFHRAPTMVLGYAMAGGLLVLTVAARVKASRNRSAALATAPRSAGTAPVLTFLGLSWLGLVYGLASAAGDVTRGWDPGLLVRNATPAALVVVPTALFLGSPLRQRWGRAPSWFPRVAGPHLVAAVLMVVVVPSAATALIGRHGSVAAREAKIAATQTSLAQLRLSMPVALWDSVGDQGGAPAFHHWGNYRYGADQFDAELLRAFPEQGFVRLREVIRVVEEGAAATTAAPGGRAAALTQAWTRLFPGSRRDRTDEVFSGEHLGFRPGLVAFPLSAAPELGRASVEQLRLLLEQRLGTAESRVVAVAGSPWRAISIAPAAPEGPFHATDVVVPKGGL
jgi:hypothetical protein